MAEGDFAVPVEGGKWQATSKRVTYAAATTGATGAQTLFTVTGLVRVKMIARSITLPTSGGTPGMSIGTAITAAGLLASIDPTTAAAGELWHDGTVDASVELDSVMAAKLVNQNIIQTIATATVTGGVIEYIVLWQPVSKDGNVVAA